MKKFNFTLQALQTLRGRQERQAFERYADAVQERTRAMERLSKVQQELDAGLSQLRQQLSVGGQVMDILHIELWCQSVESRRNEGQKEMDTAHANVEQTWRRLIEARQSREAVDKFFENQKRRYDRELAHEEQKELDELARRCTPAITALSFAPEVSWN
jgi:flagellar FliJ protein